MNHQFNEFMNEACKAMPPGWLIKIELEKDSGQVVLEDDNWDEVELCEDDMSFERCVEQKVDHARVKAGLAPHFDKDYKPEED